MLLSLRCVVQRVDMPLVWGAVINFQAFLFPGVKLLQASCEVSLQFPHTAQSFLMGWPCQQWQLSSPLPSLEIRDPISKGPTLTMFCYAFINKHTESPQLLYLFSLIAAGRCLSLQLQVCASMQQQETDLLLEIHSLFGQYNLQCHCPNEGFFQPSVGCYWHNIFILKPT